MYVYVVTSATVLSLANSSQQKPYYKPPHLVEEKRAQSKTFHNIHTIQHTRSDCA